jgi:hypothetical protein
VRGRDPGGAEVDGAPAEAADEVEAPRHLLPHLHMQLTSQSSDHERAGIDRERRRASEARGWQVVSGDLAGAAPRRTQGRTGFRLRLELTQLLPPLVDRSGGDGAAGTGTPAAAEEARGRPGRAQARTGWGPELAVPESQGGTWLGSESGPNRARRRRFHGW